MLNINKKKTLHFALTKKSHMVNGSYVNTKSDKTPYLSGSRGNRKNARSDCVLFRVQFGAAQKFGMFQANTVSSAV